MRKVKDKKNPGGFTLVELLVVLGLLAIAATMIVPRSHGGRQTLDADQIGLDMVQTLHYGLRSAQDSDRPVRFDLDTTSPCYRLETVEDIAVSSWQAIAGPLGEARAVNPELKIIDVNGFETPQQNRYQVVFDPNGTWPRGELTYSLNDEKRTIVLRGRHISMVPPPY